MFTRTEPSEITIYFDGRSIPARASDSIATALLAAGTTTTRDTALSAAPRGPYCMMGACFDCLAIVDGQSGVQTCLTPVRDGMRIERQHGARALQPDAWPTT